ncbi:MAG: 2-oxoacid:acceptor oxidoreductase subunit alpha [Deltaproteobacteria bacterium]|nr:2-oxoacid:acceptor oxidoreductase subunit alpha [Deltaproteobacteria bacterium]
MDRNQEQLDSVVIRFSGDSGDGMQLTGAQFTETTALAGNDLATFPDYPSEIRAPAGTVAGVSGFQIQFARHPVFTPGDAPDVLVAMNPAALKVNLRELKKGGIIIVNSGEFDKKSLEKAGFQEDPLQNGSLSGFRVYPINITGQTLKAVEGLPISRKEAERAKNFFALGLVYWLFQRTTEHTVKWINAKFVKSNPAIAEANVRALRAGVAHGEATEIFTHSYIVPPAEIAPGRYKNLPGNEALALGLAAAAELSGLELFLGTYPITPASDILHYLAGQKHLGIKTFQAEDEIAGICSCIGAAYSGALAVTTTSGPGLDLKTEGIGLAVILELPLIIVNVQRAGPSTGLPTKTEQADLLQAVFGRHGEAPIPVLAACSPGDCFWVAIEAARIAIRHMTPVMLLSDGFLANGAEPFPIPDMAGIPKIPVSFRTRVEGFHPYMRDENLARPWAIPGTPGLEHRVGGLEKENVGGGVSHDPANHELMCRVRADKVAKVAESYPPTEVFGAPAGDLLVVGWGSTFGAIRAAVTKLLGKGYRVGHVHLRHLHPLPNDLGSVLAKYKRVVVPEMNLGQLTMLLRARYLIDVKALSKVQGRPFKEAELASDLEAHMEVRS